MEIPQKFRVVLVEDHPMFREQLSQLINKERGMIVCGEGELIKTFLLPHHAPKGRRVP